MTSLPSARWLLLVPLAACGSGKGSALSDCEREAAAALRVCVVDHTAATASCAAGADGDCLDEIGAQDAALAAVETAVLGACGDGELAGLAATAAAARLTVACESHADSLAWRSLGGPQNAVWNDASAEDQACLAAAHATGAALVDQSLEALTVCAGSCDLDQLPGVRSQLAELAVDELEAQCDALDSLIAVDAPTFAARAARQADCLAATVFSDTAGLGLECGPDNEVLPRISATRGEWVQVVLDSEQTGTLCADGSPYAFQFRLAPEGAPLDRVLIGLQGGGVCVFEEDCTARKESNPELFQALDDEPVSVGILSEDPAESPFADYTRVLLPYCTQDVFAGGGVTEQLGALEMPRYGGRNLRVALRMVQDALWAELDAEGGAGYRPDQLTAVFGGWSAGSYGTLYNYHWLLDDLLWPRSIAFPDAGLALDNEEPIGVAALGIVKIPAWGTLPNLPPYCFASDCAVGPVLLEALSPRLRQVPEQQVLLLSNQKDQIQQRDAYFSDEAKWINTMRQDYCDTRDLNGVHWYLTSSPDSVHVVSVRPEHWSGSVAGQTMKDWFETALDDPDALESRAEEGDFVALVDGVQPFPCTP